MTPRRRTPPIRILASSLPLLSASMLPLAARCRAGCSARAAGLLPSPPAAAAGRRRPFGVVARALNLDGRGRPSAPPSSSPIPPRRICGRDDLRRGAPRPEASASLRSLALGQLRGGGNANVNDDGSHDNGRNMTTSATPPPWRRAYLGVGSNLGDRYRNVASALSALESNAAGAVRIVRTSCLRATPPMYVTDQPEFLNGAVEVETTLTPLELLRACKKAEADVGRDVGPDSDEPRYGPRVADLDVLLCDGYEMAEADGSPAETLAENELTPCSLVLNSEELEVPHPRMAEREFVLAPLVDLEGASGGRPIVHPELNRTAGQLLEALRNRTRADDGGGRAVRALPLPRGRFLFLNETAVMGILNVTPDSFSDGGQYDSSAEAAAEQAFQMERDGAALVDVGGESTRPGAQEADVDEELRRVIPVIERIRRDSDVPISIDTRRAVVARAAVEAGADVVNDVSGGMFDPDMLPCVADLGVPMVLMHMRGNPQTMQSLTEYGDEGSEEGVVGAVARELTRRSVAAERAGVRRWLQVLDPGIGFAKDLEGNLSLLGRAAELRRRCGGLPLLWGPSRKGFIGKLSGEADPKERDFGTVAACLAALDDAGDEEVCTLLRVHNVRAVKQAVAVYEAIRDARR
ncbi:hypothetical protein ACHAWF_016967 [Thalassiosira exigua]